VSEDLKQAVTRRGSFWRSFVAVAWSFFGVRKNAEYEKDVARLNPLHVIIAGIVAAVVFVLALWALVRWVVASGVAA
jgi:Protein of unknown function (DUF2970)